MAKKVLLECTKCKQETEHWDNRDTKRGKQPDYKCVDCGKGIWINSKTPQPKTVQKTASNPSNTGGNVGNKISSSYYGRWAVDIAIASVEKKLPLQKLVDAFALALEKVGNILNANTTPDPDQASNPADAPVDIKEPVSQQEETQEVDDTNFDDLDI